jgi:hypothetical protein
METESHPGITFRFHHPKSTQARKSSSAMTEALRHLTKTDEMKQFIAEGRSQGRKVLVEVFHAAADGHPLIIHTALMPKMSK